MKVCLKLVFLLAIFLWGLPAQARDGFGAAIPSHSIFPTPSGIIFPSLLTAAGNNPAALPQRITPAKVMALNYSPPPGGGAHQYAVDFATGDKRIGLGAGYIGSVDPSSGPANHSIFLGGGFRSESTSLGISLRDGDLKNGFSPETDIGVIAQGPADLTYGLVLYHMDRSPQLDLGIGFGKDKSYNFEINVLMPPIKSAFQPGAAYTFTAATTVYASIFGISFVSSYTTVPAQVSQGVSFLVWLSKNLGVTIQYRSPNRSYYGFVLNF